MANASGSVFAKDGVADAVNLTFVPLPGGGSAACQQADGVDACAIYAAGCIGGCTGASAATLGKFAGCFEGVRRRRQFRVALLQLSDPRRLGQRRRNVLASCGSLVREAVDAVALRLCGALRRAPAVARGDQLEAEVGLEQRALRCVHREEDDLPW